MNVFLCAAHVVSAGDDDDGVYNCDIHTSPISTIFCPTNNRDFVYTSSYDGSVRALNLQKEVFQQVKGESHASRDEVCETWATSSSAAIQVFAIPYDRYNGFTSMEIVGNTCFLR